VDRRQRVVAVVGMHRTGTSAVTAGLAALGVELGSDLIAAGPKENPKGFFEDAWVLDLSERLLDRLALRWDSMALLEEGWWRRADLDELRLEACEQLRRRFGRAPRFGFKNPRSARLLPFWQDVFSRLDLGDSYVVVVRNPISVARSLAARNGFHPAKSHLLWLLHTLEAWSHTAGRRRVFVDFDALVADPGACMRRVARGLGIGLSAKRRSRLEEFARDFVEERLRHSRFEDSDVALDADAPALSRRAFAALSALARGGARDGDPALERERSEIAEAIASLRPLFEHVERLEGTAQDLAREGESARRAFEAQLGASRAELERERAALEGELRGVREALAGSLERGERLEGELSGAREALAHGERARAEAEGELRARREQAEASRAELERAREALAAALDEGRAARDGHARELAAVAGELAQARAELGAIDRELADARAAREVLAAELSGARAGREAVLHELVQARTQADRELAEARGVLDSLRADLARELGRGEQLASELAAAAAAARELAVRRRQRADSLARHARELAQWLEQLRATRTWRLTRRVQRALDRLRRLPTADALAQLGRHARHFESLCAREPLPDEELRELAERMRAEHVAAIASDSFRVARAAAFLQNLLRLRAPAAGPAELVAGHVEALRLGLGLPPGAPAPAVAPAPQRSDIVDVIVPVHRGVEQTRRCLESVRRARPLVPYELIAIDDSGGDPEMTRALDTWQRELGLTLLRNPGNLGFVASVNRGIALHPDRDVLLLNSDAAVHGDWLDRLRRAAYSEWRIGSVTPWSNDAEICSYPSMCRANEMPGEAELAEIDARMARVHAGRTATLPTSVGFCSYLRRDCLEDVGSFDEARFGAGYGEENDFSMRARALGWRHVLAADTFVAHAGGVSFGESKAPRIAQAMRVLESLHPRYLPEVAEFVRSDPLRPLRRAADLDRAGADRAGASPALLLVCHALDGGTGRHVLELADRWREEGVRPYLLQPVRGSSGAVRLAEPGVPATPNLCFEPGEETELVHSLRELGIRHVHFHHTLGLPHAALRLPGALGVAYDFTVHDYFPICPRVHLIDASGRYCGEPDALACGECVRHLGSPVGSEIDVARWREDFGALLAGARRVFVPSEDLAKRLARHFPALELTHRPHFEPTPPPPPPPPPDSDVLRVAVIGAIGEHKGSRVLVECVRDADRRALPLEFHLVGYSDRDDELRALERVVVHGPYREGDVYGILAGLACQRALLPSVWPETHCYALSIALDSELCPVSFDLGAIAERIRALGWGELMDLDATAGDINDRLLSMRVPPFPQARHARLRRRYESLRSDYYDRPF
jgi:GT2 family glycosyltransferase/glycosyltransferase involved in cell wall biosynthesis